MGKDNDTSIEKILRFIQADIPTKNKVSEVLSILKDVDILTAKEAVGIVSNYLFKVGQESQRGIMLTN